MGSSTSGTLGQGNGARDGSRGQVGQGGCKPPRFSRMLASILPSVIEATEPRDEFEKQQGVGNLADLLAAASPTKESSAEGSGREFMETHRRVSFPQGVGAAESNETNFYKYGQNWSAYGSGEGEGKSAPFGNGKKGKGKKSNDKSPEGEESKS
eukprot:3099568-Amphidinium_carterae.2